METLCATYTTLLCIYNYLKSSKILPFRQKFKLTDLLPLLYTFAFNSEIFFSHVFFSLPIFYTLWG